MMPQWQSISTYLQNGATHEENVFYSQWKNSRKQNLTAQHILLKLV